MNDLSGSFPFINQDGNSFSRIQSVHPLVSLFHKQEKIFQPTQRCQAGKDWQSFKKKIVNFCCAKKKEREDFCYSQRYSCRWWTPHAHAGTKDVARGWRPIDNRRQRAVKRDGGGDKIDPKQTHIWIRSSWIISRINDDNIKWERSTAVTTLKWTDAKPDLNSLRGRVA